MPRKLLLAALVVAGLATAAAVTGAPGLSYHRATPRLDDALSSFTVASYSACSTHHSGPCLAYLNSSDYPTTAGHADQQCSRSDFSGYPFGSNGNVGSSGKTIDDSWMFVASPVNLLNVQLTFTDASHHTHSVSFPTAASPPNPQPNSANVYYTQNYSNVAVLTPPGWTLTGGTGLVSGLRSGGNTFDLSYTCAGNSQLGNYDSNHKRCDYPGNPSQIWGTKSSYGSSWQVSGGLNENDCHVPGGKVHCTGHNFSSYVTTDANGDFDLTGIPKSAFPLTFSYPGDPNAGWPSAQSFTLN